jgi:acyl-CoA synthetase (AMP-forming)/AMP-acid ligase II
VYVGSKLTFEGYTGGADKHRLDGLVATGDLGHLDPDGRLTIDGREDDMVITGGENVFPRSVEDVLAGHPAVGEVAVVGVPDEDLGQRLVAYVALAGDHPLDGEDLRAWARPLLARYALPRRVVVVDALPRNATGKVVTRDLPSPN